MRATRLGRAMPAAPGGPTFVGDIAETIGRAAPAAHTTRIPPCPNVAHRQACRVTFGTMVGMK